MSSLSLDPLLHGEPLIQRRNGSSNLRKKNRARHNISSIASFLTSTSTGSSLPLPAATSTISGTNSRAVPHSQYRLLHHRNHKEHPIALSVQNPKLHA
uniref:Uncharacterized protein n=1 Tax=Arundo donax TaxID=35708 RepID=A0A0A8ZL90_ARUDO